MVELNGDHNLNQADIWGEISFLDPGLLLGLGQCLIFLWTSIEKLFSFEPFHKKLHLKLKVQLSPENFQLLGADQEWVPWEKCCLGLIVFVYWVRSSDCSTDATSPSFLPMIMSQFLLSDNFCLSMQIFFQSGMPGLLFMSANGIKWNSLIKRCINVFATDFLRI